MDQALAYFRVDFNSFVVASLAYAVIGETLNKLNRYNHATIEQHTCFMEVMLIGDGGTSRRN